MLLTTDCSNWQHYETIDSDDSCLKQRELPTDYKPDYRAIALSKSRAYRPPGRLFYGFGLNFQDVIDYADKYSLIDPSVDSDGGGARYVSARCVGLDHLRDLCRFEDLDITLPISPEYQIVLAMYDNYTIDEFELETDQEEDVIRILKEEIPVFRTQNPRWFYDRMDGKNDA